MKNITVSIDDETHRQARIRAAELDTSVSALVRGYLKRLVSQPVNATEIIHKEVETESRRSRLNEAIEDITANGGGLIMSDNLPREALYNRDALR